MGLIVYYNSSLVKTFDLQIRRTGMKSKGRRTNAHAGATAVVMLAAGSAAPRDEPPPVEVRADRPFLFAIQHLDSGACLFLGRVTDPRSE